MTRIWKPNSKVIKENVNNMEVRTNSVPISDKWQILLDIRTQHNTMEDSPGWFFSLFHLLEVLDLVLGAAPVGVGRLPPHQRDALLLDLLRPELADERRRCRKKKSRIPNSQSICITWGFSQKLRTLPREFSSRGCRKENSEFPPEGVSNERTAAAAAAKWRIKSGGH